MTNEIERELKEALDAFEKATRDHAWRGGIGERATREAQYERAKRAINHLIEVVCRVATKKAAGNI